MFGKNHIYLGYFLCTIISSQNYYINFLWSCFQEIFNGIFSASEPNITILCNEHNFISYVDWRKTKFTFWYWKTETERYSNLLVIYNFLNSEQINQFLRLFKRNRNLVFSSLLSLKVFFKKWFSKVFWIKMIEFENIKFFKFNRVRVRENIRNCKWIELSSLKTAYN